MHTLLRAVLHILEAISDGFMVYNSGITTSAASIESAATRDLLCGDGSDGDLVFDGSGTISGIATYASGEYTVIKNINADDMTVSADILINTNGYFVRGRGTLTLGANAHIHNDGTDNTGQGSAPTTTTSGTIFKGGGTGTVFGTGGGAGGNNSLAITGANFQLGGDGGNAGGCTGATGGTGSTNGAPMGATNGDKLYSLATLGCCISGVGIGALGGGLGGGRGAGFLVDAGGTRGGGGSGGGVCVVIVDKIIWGSGSKISADGGSGQNGVASVNVGAENDTRGGGGGGGGGGCVVICREASGTSSVTAAGGTGGTSAGTTVGQVDGSAGVNGYAVYLVG